MLPDLISIAIMAFAVALLIRWGDWILANLDDALGEEATTRQTGGGGPSISTGRRGSHHHSSRPVSHSGRGGI